MGSGTTAEVALATGRFVLGFELEPRYIEIAKQRVDAYADWEHGVRAQRALPIFEQEPQLATLDFG